MTEANTSKLNQMGKSLPQGMVVDAAWLERKLGISPSLRNHYVESGWLERLTRGVYRRPVLCRGENGEMRSAPLKWQQVLISVQNFSESDDLAGCPLILGGETALDMHGLSHYLKANVKYIHLYGRVYKSKVRIPDNPDEKIPKWLNRLGLPQRFVLHNSERLFKGDSFGTDSIRYNFRNGKNRDTFRSRIRSVEEMAWGEWEWPLTLSTPERAFLEMLDEIPQRQTFHNASMIMQGAVNFRPHELIKLLHDCKSIKVKRLFLFLADRHNHAWFKHLDKEVFDLGKGKRVIAEGGRLDTKYQITVPGDIHDDF